MIEARWNGRVIARSDDTVLVEGNHYFPLASIDAALLRPSDTTTICPWKGVAHYYHLHADGADNPDAAWYYPDPQGGGGEYPRAGGLLERRRGRLTAPAIRG